MSAQLLKTHSLGWFLPGVLRALGEHVQHVSQPWTTVDLLRWAPELVRPVTDKLACELLVREGLLCQLPGSKNCMRRPQNVLTFQTTAEGWAACQGAVARVREQTKLDRRRAQRDREVTRTLYGRLWTLLRNRQLLTASEAAETLTDAGDDVRTVQARAAEYLGQWRRQLPEHIQVSSKRVNGFLRYVVVRDPGPVPPIACKARKGETQ